MEAKLIVALDQYNKIYKTLKTMDLYELDCYMTEHFTDSKEVHNHPEFAPVIAEFLEKNKQYLASCSRKNNGSIRVIYTDNQGYVNQVRSYYKKDSDKVKEKKLKSGIKKALLNDPTFLRQICKKYHHRIPEHYRKDIYYGLKNNIKSRYELGLGHWLSSLSVANDSYIILRSLTRDIEKHQEEQELTLEVEKGTVKVGNSSIMREPCVLQRTPKAIDYMKTHYQDMDTVYQFYSLDELSTTSIDNIDIEKMGLIEQRKK